MPASLAIAMASPAEDVMPTREPSIATVSEKNEEQEKNLDELDRNLDESPPSATAPPPTPAPDVPPNGGYGWVCCAATFWINAHTWGLNSVRSFLLTSSFTPTLTAFPELRRLLGSLPVQQCLPRRNPSRLRFRWRSFNLTGFVRGASGHHDHSPFWNSCDASYWSFL